MFRKIFFWAHLAVGLAGGVLIAVMSFTGAALTFEKDILVWAEGDARRIDVPAAGGTRLRIDDAVGKALAAHPDWRISNATVSSDPRDALILGMPGNLTAAVNPYTGEVKEVTAPRTRAFMQTMRAWHTRLNFKAGPGNAGAAINAAANVGFVFLVVSGLVIWWPRAWRWPALRPSVWFVRTAGKARDWNWHNVFGLWFLPVLFVLAGTGVVLSYRWANVAVFQVMGEQPPANLAPPAPPPLKLAAPAAGAAPLGSDELIAAVQKAYPEWTQVTLRFGNPRTSVSPAAAPRTYAAVVRQANAWPRFDQPVVTVDAYDGRVVRTEGYETLSPGMRARRWIRLLHSGEALGSGVQLLSGLACVAGCLLVYTGFALAWRRFVPRRNPAGVGAASE